MLPAEPAWSMTFTHKVTAPHRPSYLITRHRLLIRMKGCAEHRLTTIVAPAGYGKTSLLIDLASHPPLPVCWCTLDTGDGDPWALIDSVTSAIERTFPGATSRTRALLASRADESLAGLARALARDVDAAPELLLILDDWHLVDEMDGCGQIVGALLESCPTCHVVLASRAEPSVPGRMLLASRRQLLRLTEADLAFTVDEAASALAAGGAEALGQEELSALVEQSGGWMTGILLGASAGGSGEAPIYDYFAEQVFAQQPPELQRFLLDTTLMEELTAERCNAVLGRDDSVSCLMTLVRHRAFISEERPGVLRYHALFRAFLIERARADRASFARAARAIAASDLAAGRWQAAFTCCTLAGDRAGAERIISTVGEQLYLAGRLETLERWFAALDPQPLATPSLCLRALVARDRGRHSETEALARLAEERGESEHRVVVLLMRARIARAAGRYAEADRLAGEALALGPGEADRALALRVRAICAHRSGRTEAAIPLLTEALTIRQRLGDHAAAARLEHDLGICQTSAGRLAAAACHLSRADAYWAASGSLSQRALTLNSLGGVLHLQGRLREAYATLSEALRFAQDAGIPDYRATVRSALGELLLDLQCWDAAREAYEAGRRDGGTAYMAGYLDLALVRLLMRQGRAPAARAMLDRLDEETLAAHPLQRALLELQLAMTGDGRMELPAARERLEAAACGAGAIDAARARMWLAVAEAHAAADDDALRVAGPALVEALSSLEDGTVLVAELAQERALLRQFIRAGERRVKRWLRAQDELARLGRHVIGAAGRSVLEVRALGGDEILLDGVPLAIGWQRAREVLHALVAHPRGMEAEALREAIWPESEGPRASHTLASAVHALREALPEEAIQRVGRSGYRLSERVLFIEEDAAQLLGALDAAGDDDVMLEDALSRYDGPYLPTSSSIWAISRRKEIERRVRGALTQLAERHEEQGDLRGALELYHRLLALDELDEAVHAAVMRCELALGNRHAVISQYQRMCEVLERELGLLPEPGSEAERLYQEEIRVIRIRPNLL